MTTMDAPQFVILILGVAYAVIWSTLGLVAVSIAILRAFVKKIPHGLKQGLHTVDCAETRSNFCNCKEEVS